MERELQPSARNYLKAMLFQSPDWIPTNVSIMPATWFKYGPAIEEIVLEHPRLFPHYREGDYKELQLQRQYRAGRWVDTWGTVWLNIEEGLDSLPVDAEAPLRDWAAFEGYAAPDPLMRDDWVSDPVDWQARARQVVAAKTEGRLAGAGLAHGFMYMRLFYLRGFTNLMLDIAAREPRLDRLIALVRDRNVAMVRRWLDLGVDIVHAGDDLGMQTALPMSPADWRRYLKPAYRAIVAPCVERGVYFYLHTDGHILEIIPDLVECGVTVVNPQIRANGLEGLSAVAKGKVCINLDLDRQLFPFADRRELQEHIHTAIDSLNSPRGGLMLTAECEPDVPLESVRTIVETLEDCGCGLT
ncbi:MAG: uroporphyrinogen decarboxylase family protein [Anaerolineae bacterium]